MTINDFSSLDVLKECDLIRVTKIDNDIKILVVADNEDEHHSHYLMKDELGDEQQEYLEEDHDACDEMNGHLFLLIFHNTSNVVLPEEEFDSYQTLKVEVKDKTLTLVYLGLAFDKEEKEILVSFTYDSYEVIDKGKIVGPEV